MATTESRPAMTGDDAAAITELEQAVARQRLVVRAHQIHVQAPGLPFGLGPAAILDRAHLRGETARERARGERVGEQVPRQ